MPDIIPRDPPDKCDLSIQYLARLAGGIQIEVELGLEMCVRHGLIFGLLREEAFRGV